MKKMILKVEVHDDEVKTEVMKAVSAISGVESFSVNMKDQILTLVGDVDPVYLMHKLRKLCHAVFVSVGPAKEEKKEQPNKEEKPEENKKQLAGLVEAYGADHNEMRQEDPNGCVIC